MSINTEVQTIEKFKINIFGNQTLRNIEIQSHTIIKIKNDS